MSAGPAAAGVRAAAACLVGGVSLAGGRGWPAGLLAGTLSVAIDAPGLRRVLDRLRARTARLS